MRDEHKWLLDEMIKADRYGDIHVEHMDYARTVEIRVGHEDQARGIKAYFDWSGPSDDAAAKIAEFMRDPANKGKVLVLGTGIRRDAANAA